ncbi:hypothetical protein HPB47_007076, partial [Ixodes persulcatus]
HLRQLCDVELETLARDVLSQARSLGSFPTTSSARLPFAEVHMAWKSGSWYYSLTSRTSVVAGTRSDKCGGRSDAEGPGLPRGIGNPPAAWPPCGADMYVIENVWGLLKRTLLKRNLQDSSKQTLWTALSEEWEKLRLDDQLPAALFQSLPRRMRDVISFQGGHMPQQFQANKHAEALQAASPAWIVLPQATSWSRFCRLPPG